jgi:hypothetical protein
MARMKMKTGFFLGLIGVALIAVGCVSTVNDRKQFSMQPWSKDQLPSKYERSVEQCFAAAVAVVAHNGTVERETTLVSSNAIRALEGKVNGRSVWVRVEAVTPTVTGVTVQALGSWGGTDIDLVAQLDKEIALKLAQSP